MQIVFKNVNKDFGARHLFDVEYLSINDKDKVGFVGRNGTGKTTFLNVLAGYDEEYDGDIIKSGVDSIGFLKQNLGLDLEGSIYDEVLKGAEEFIKIENEIENIRQEIEREKSEETLKLLTEKYDRLLNIFEERGGYKYKSMVEGSIKGLGFKQEDFTKQIKELSGGQKMRVSLAKLLVSSPDILLLDEPTNYLDTDSIGWLENFLVNYKNAIIVVSHDRYFLDKVTNTIWEIEDEKVTSFKGNYSSYVKLKSQLRQEQERLYKKQSDEIKHQKEVIDKLKSYNREKSVKRARSREKALEKMELVNKPKNNKVSLINFEYEDVVSNNLLEVKNITFGYDERKILKDVSFDLIKGEKIGICGRNAQGKTTLLKLINGKLKYDNGLIKIHPKAILGYFEQEHFELNPLNSIIEELRSVSKEDDGYLRNLLGRMMFYGDDYLKKIGTLSGGEKSRVALCKIMLSSSTILLLDEPTNHLDMETKEVLEDALINFKGSIIAVSHDRYFLNKVCNKIVYVNEGKANVYNGNYDFFLSKRIVEHEIKYDNKDKEVIEKKKTSGKLSNNKRKNLIKRVDEIETEIEQIEAEKKELLEKLNSSDIAKDIEKFNLISSEFDLLNKKSEELEEEWLNSHLLLESDG